ncbi:hypothetical protein [Aliiroseovarius sp. YM-037]|uniref:hypothetical protein n=1 Tax=Aliiroseovarius sp. YM-037 TaxID=3341728 RepID=UPI003A7F7628
MKRIAFTAALLALAGCMQAPPTVSERNAAGIRLETGPGAIPQIALDSTQRKAARFCDANSKEAVYIDTRPLSDGGAEHYYTCF